MQFLELGKAGKNADITQGVLAQIQVGESGETFQRCYSGQTAVGKRQLLKAAECADGLQAVLAQLGAGDGELVR